MELIIGLVIGIAIAAVISGTMIWLLSKLNLGLKVDNFGWAILAGVVIGVLTNLPTHFLPESGIAVKAVIGFVVAAVAIYVSGQFLKGLTVKGFGGALLAAAVIVLINLGVLLLIGGTPAA